MATYRLIHCVAATGERSSSLNHLQFRVWMQYQLSADDYGICPADASKFRGDNPALREESDRKVQTAIEAVIKVGLVGTFMDGRLRYLYQHDWQDWQRIKWPTETTYPVPPAEVLAKCSPSTVELFRKRCDRTGEKLPLHACARDANATANAPALEEGSGETRPQTGLTTRGANAPNSLPRDHIRHAVCGQQYRFCLSENVFGKLAKQYGGTDDEARLAIQGWVNRIETEHESIGDFLWIQDHFTAFLRQSGRLKDAPRVTSPDQPPAPNTAHDQKIRDMERGVYGGR